jgi:membrane-bound lytic murein transglycosylase D
MRLVAAVSLLAAVMLFAVASYAESDPSLRKPSPSPQIPLSDRRIAELEKEIAVLKKEVSFTKMPAIPEQLSLCDKNMPLLDEDIREDFEREFYQFLENKGLLTILVRRHGKFFTAVSAEIDRVNLPPDLIYLAIVESYLNPRAKSSAAAGGMWQFIKDTGKREGLFISDAVDERYSVTRATRSALSYLKKLHDEFGDWFLAMAAYNCGEGRIREAITNQNSKDFFELFLPEETDRYVYRIAALKEILGNPSRYGLPIEKRDYYRPYGVAEVTVDVTDKEIHTLTLSQAMEVPYKVFREYNLQIRKYRLPRGTYHICVPFEKKEVFLKGLRNCPSVSVQRQG